MLCPWIGYPSPSSSNNWITEQVTNKICTTRTECSNTSQCKRANTVWSGSKKTPLPEDQTKPTFNLRLKSCKWFRLVLIFIACSLTEISKINGSINLQHKIDKVRRRNIACSCPLICSAQAASARHGNRASCTSALCFSHLHDSLLLFHLKQITNDKELISQGPNTKYNKIHLLRWIYLLLALYFSQPRKKRST